MISKEDVWSNKKCVQERAVKVLLPSSSNHLSHTARTPTTTQHHGTLVTKNKIK